jgi:hypothetical protein
MQRQISKIKKITISVLHDILIKFIVMVVIYIKDIIGVNIDQTTIMSK